MAGHLLFNSGSNESSLAPQFKWLDNTFKCIGRKKKKQRKVPNMHHWNCTVQVYLHIFCQKERVIYNINPEIFMTSVTVQNCNFKIKIFLAEYGRLQH